MSLLPQKVYNDIVELVINNVTDVSDRSDLLFDLHHWNESQRRLELSTYNPDWKSLPDDIKEVVIKIEFHGDRYPINKDEKFVFKRPEHPKPHIHAEMIAKYAQAAARRSDPWLEFKCRCVGDTYWVPLTKTPSFKEGVEYLWLNENN